jgi:hypothetical protein
MRTNATFFFLMFLNLDEYRDNSSLFIFCMLIWGVVAYNAMQDNGGGARHPPREGFFLGGTYFLVFCLPNPHYFSFARFRLFKALAWSFVPSAKYVSVMHPGREVFAHGCYAPHKFQIRGNLKYWKKSGSSSKHNMTKYCTRIKLFGLEIILMVS